MFRRGQPGHHLDLQVAVLQLPLVVLLEQHRADQPRDGGLIGDDADDIGAAFGAPSAAESVSPVPCMATGVGPT